MALTKDQTSSCSFFRNMLEAGSTVQFPHISPYEFDDYTQKQDGDSPCSNKKKMMSNHVMSISHSPPLSSSSSANSSNGFTSHHPTASSGYQHHEEAHSLINFKTNTGFHASSFIMQGGGGSLLSFQQDQDQTNDTIPKLSHSSIDNHHYHPLWEGSSGGVGMNHQQSNQLVKPLRLMDEVNCLQTASSSYQDSANEWLYCAEASMSDPPQESASQQTCFNNKRPHTEEENMHALKKQNTSTSASKKAAKPKSSSSSKDPQSIAAKNRRERISERLKILQDLVPNGSKVDLVTMLEKAISYVKFLQLQVKVLATDEFWPAAGGKAPDISQVREAIDAILSSQRSDQRTTSSSSK